MLSRITTTAARQSAPVLARHASRSSSAVASFVGGRISASQPQPETATFPDSLASYSSSRRSLSTEAEETDHQLAAYAYEKSCYCDMDFTINEEDVMYNAVQRFSAFKVGSLVVTDDAGEFPCLFRFISAVLKC